MVRSSAQIKYFFVVVKNFLLSASMSVKDVLQSLVDDAMVDTERIGTSNYFWSYPSKALHSVSITTCYLKRDIVNC